MNQSRFQLGLKYDLLLLFILPTRERFGTFLFLHFKLCRLRLNQKLPARHCVFKMDRFCVSGPSFPPAGHAATVQNLSHRPFFLEIQSLPSWFGGLCFPNCSIDVLGVNGGADVCVPGDLGRIKRDQRRSGSKNLWFRFFSLFFPPSLSLITPSVRF